MKKQRIYPLIEKKVLETGQGCWKNVAAAPLGV